MKFLAGLLAMVMMLASTASAGTVETTGRGIDRQSAIRAALRQAIEMELGAVVESRSRVKNYQLIEQEIALNSSGFVEHYEIISEGQLNGMFEVKVRADVQSEKLRAELMSRLQKKSLIETTMNDPRIKVRAVDAGGFELIAVENEFIKALRAQGFNYFVEEIDNADYLADIRVSDEAIAARLISAVDGKIICAESFDKRKRMFTDTDRWAINNAARVLARAALENAAQIEQHITLTVVSQSIDLNALVERLKGMSGVNDVFRRSLIEFDINFDGTADDLARALERDGMIVRELSASTIKI